MNPFLIVSMILAALCTALAVALFATQRKNTAQGTSDSDADLSDDAMHILGALECDTILIDESGDVIRATPDVYRLGLVDNDAVSDERLREQIIAVRADGVPRRFPLTTQTVSEYVVNEETMRAQAAASQALFAATRRAADAAFDVTPRTNYLSVTVARITDRLILVMAVDISERRRFEQVRDDFTSHVASRIQEPAARIEQLAASLADPNVSERDMRAHAGEVEGEARYMRHLTADLSVLLRAQETVTPAAENRVDAEAIVCGTVARERAAAQKCGVTISLTIPDTPLMVHGDSTQPFPNSWKMRWSIHPTARRSASSPTRTRKESARESASSTTGRESARRIRAGYLPASGAEIRRSEFTAVKTAQGWD